MCVKFSLRDEIITGFYYVDTPNSEEFRQILNDLEGEYFAQIWLSDKVSDEKALTAVFPMVFTHNSELGSLLKPKYVEVDKNFRLPAHLIYKPNYTVESLIVD